MNSGPYPMQQLPVVSHSPQSLVYPPTGNTFIVQTATNPREWGHYKAKCSLVLGVTLVLCSLLAVILNVAGLLIVKLYGQLGWTYGYGMSGFHIGHGFWGSILYLFAGGYAIRAARRKTTCLITANLVLSIMAAMLSSTADCLGTGLGLTFAMSSTYLKPIAAPSDESKTGAITTTSGDLSSTLKLELTLHYGMAALAVIKFLTAVASSGICCRAICCGKTKKTVTTTHHVAAPQPMLVQGPILIPPPISVPTLPVPGIPTKQIQDDSYLTFPNSTPTRQPATPVQGRAHNEQPHLAGQSNRPYVGESIIYDQILDPDPVNLRYEQISDTGKGNMEYEQIQDFGQGNQAYEQLQNNEETHQRYEQIQSQGEGSREYDEPHNQDPPSEYETASGLMNEYHIVP